MSNRSYIKTEQSWTMKSQIESRAEQQETRGNQQGFVDKQKIMAKQQKTHVLQTVRSMNPDALVFPSENGMAPKKTEQFLRDKTVLFDMDGTLLDTFEPILISMRYATKKVLGRVIPDSVLVEGVGQPLVDQMVALADEPNQSDVLLKVYRAHNEQNLYENSKPFAGVAEMVAEVKALGAKVGVVTSKRHSIASGSLSYYGLLDQFDCFVGLEDSTEHKPNPEPLFVAANMLNVNISSCIYVGDSPYDMQAAQAAGIPHIAVTWGKFFSREILEAEHPQKLIDSPNELVKALYEILLK